MARENGASSFIHSFAIKNSFLKKRSDTAVRTPYLTLKEICFGTRRLFQGVLAWKRLFWNGFLRPIQEEYRYVLYLILTVLKRPLKWDRARLWTPTGSASTGRQSWMCEKNLRFSTETEVFFERSTLTAGGGRSSGSSKTCSISF